MSSLAIFSPSVYSIMQYVLLVNFCGEKATNEYYKCMAKMVGVDLLVTTAAKALEKLSYAIAKTTGKAIHIIGLGYAIYEFYECNKELALTCDSKQ